MNYHLCLIVLLCWAIGGNASYAMHKMDPLIIQQLKQQQKLDKIWVFFKDKGNKIKKRSIQDILVVEDHEIPMYKDHFLQNSNSIIMTKRAIERRQKAGIMQIHEDDHPVNDIYMDFIRNDCLKQSSIRVVSRWLNAVSIDNVDEETIKCIGEKDFVKSMKRVAKLKRKSEDSIRDPLESQARAVSDSIYGNAEYQLKQLNVIKVHEEGYLGNNVTMIILDSGFRLKNDILHNVHIVDTWDFVFNDSNVDNDNDDEVETQYSHGTRALSCIAGKKDYVYSGTAPNARMILAKTEDMRDESTTEEDNFVAAIEWGEKLGAQVLSASLGYDELYPYEERDGKTSICTVGVNKAIEKGLVCVVSAGNSGIGHIAVPADAYEVISVGAVDLDGTIAGFSSIGPSADNRLKPEVSARGVSTIVALPDSATGTYTSSGTSFSCPLVAGTVALILEKHPNLTPTEVRYALMNSGNRASDPNNEYGYGIPDIHAIIQGCDPLTCDGYCKSNICIHPQEDSSSSTLKVSLSLMLILLSFFF